jgi:hypothetical protein
MSKNTALYDLEEAADKLKEAEFQVEKTAITARAEGASWAEIASSLGITKQRAHQRYSEKVREARAERYAEAEAGPARELTDEEEQREADGEFYREHLAGQSVTPSIFLEAPAPAHTKNRSKKVDAPAPALKAWTAESPQENYIDKRPKHTIPGPIPATAEPGTGKGPHACPRCGRTNHYTEWRDIAALFPDCTPTRYDSPRMTTYMNGTS